MRYSIARNSRRIVDISGWSQTAVETSPILFVFERHSARLCENIFRGNDPRRIIIITRPAKTAALRTAARDLDQQPIAHLGFRRPDRSRWAKNVLIYEKIRQLGFAAFQCPTQCAFLWIYGRESPPDAPGNTFLIGNVIENRPVIVVDDIVKRRHIEAAADPCERKQNIVFAFVLTGSRR